MNYLLPFALALALAACATTGNNEPSRQSSSPEREYRTGSRIPVRDPAAATVSPAKTLDPSALGPSAPVRTN